MKRLLRILKENTLFLYEYISKPRTVGSIVPSSSTLAKSISSCVDFGKKNLVILEYGPGTGPFTSEISKRLKPGDTFILIEQNEKFVTLLNNKFKNSPSIKVYHDDVENVQSILHGELCGNVDYIVSGIPFSSIPKAAADRILLTTASLMNESSLFIAFQYSPFKLSAFKRHFTIVKKKFVLKNIPSAYIISMKSKLNAD